MKKILWFYLFSFCLCVFSEELVLQEKDLYGYPSQPKQILKKEAYTSGYNSDQYQPDWVGYVLKIEHLSGAKYDRTNKFKADQTIQNGATPADYKNSGYDKGHMAPAADMAYSEKVMVECFLMTNMCPQAPDLNREKWNELETWVRSYVKGAKTLIVFSGPIFEINSTPRKTIGVNHKIPIPDGFFKIIFSPDRPRRMFAFIMPNRNCIKSLQNYEVTVRDVEKKVGMNFFKELPQPEQDKLETELHPEDIP